MELWNKIGKTMESMIEQGMFPGIGYDNDQWEAWVFFENPVEGIGDLMRNKKVFAESATEAVEKLAEQVLKKEEINGQE